jgi:potassium/chloride transporter 4/5/6
MAGSIDAVAPLVTTFYLLCYGGVNMACFLQDWLGSPNWRPKWKYYHKSASFTGIVFCFACMIIISWWASMLAVVGAILMYAYLEKRS